MKELYVARQRYHLWVTIPNGHWPSRLAEDDIDEFAD